MGHARRTAVNDDSTAMEIRVCSLDAVSRTVGTQRDRGHSAIIKPWYNNVMSHMTTTVRLPNDLYEALRKRAFEEHRAVAEVIREALRRFLEAPSEPPPLPELDADPFWKAVGTVDGGPSDESVEHDHYLYGTAPRTRR